MNQSLGFIPFGEVSPDIPDLLNTGIEEANNTVPQAKGYYPLPELAAYSNALASAPLAATIATDKTGNRFVYAATAQNLYALSGITWSDVSLGGPGYTSAATRWEFVKWGETMQAWSLNNDPQTINLGGVNYSALTTAFKARTAGVVHNNFIVAGNTFDTTDDERPTRIRWCAYNDASDWTPSALTLSDFQDLKGPGEGVQRVMGGEYGIIIDKNTIHRLTFVGAPVVFRPDLVETHIGTQAPDSCVRLGNRVFFLADDGFRVTTGTEKSQLIGHNRVDRTVLADLDFTYVDQMKSALYREKQSVIWAYPGVGNVNGQCNRLALYNYATGRWAFGDEVIECLMLAAVPYRSLDDFDTDFPDLDLMPGTLDDPSYSGGKVQLGAFGDDDKLSFFTGAPRTMTIETQEASIVPGRRAYLDSARVGAVGDGATARVRVGTRNSLSDAVVWSTWTVNNGEGLYPLRVDARYFRFQVEVSGEYDHVFGMEPIGSPSSAR